MIRPEPKQKILSRLRWGLRERLERMVTDKLMPVRMERLASPQVRLLEPRFVLNASAELVLGQLLVTGTEAAETVQLEVHPDGDLSLREGARVVPIEMQPSGSSDRVDPSAVSEIVFRMGDGVDTLDLQLPNGLDVTVETDDGNGRTILRSDTAGSIVITDPSSPIVTLSDDVSLSGDVFFGIAGRTSQLKLDGGGLTVDGRLILTGDVTVVGSGSLDLSDAVIAAETSGTNLRIDLDHSAKSVLALGGAVELDGRTVEDLSVASANRVVIGNMQADAPALLLGGSLNIRDVAGETHLDSAIDSQAVSVETDGDIFVTNSIDTDGPIKLLSRGSSLTIAADLTTANPNSQSQIDLSGQSVEFVDASLTTAGGLVRVAGPVQIDGDVTVDTGVGPITFLDAVQSADQTGGALKINTLGAVRFDQPIGASSASAPGDLSGLDVTARQIEVHSIGVRNGNVDLTADVIRLFGNQLRTSSSGDVVVTGHLFLPVGDTNISSAGSALFTSSVAGQPGTHDLQVTAVGDAFFDGAVLNVRNFQVAAGEQARFLDDATLSGDMQVDANVSGNLPPDATSVLIQNDAVVSVGSATIQIDGGGRRIDVGRSTLRSVATGDAITLQDSTDVVLGNVVAQPGMLIVGIDENVRGETMQFAGKTLDVDRLVASTIGRIDLSNPENKIKSLQSVSTADGAITIDAQTTLAVISVVSKNIFAQDDRDGDGGPGSRDVRLTVHGAESDLVVTTIDAMNGADVILEAGDDILDSDRNDENMIKSNNLGLTSHNLTNDQTVTVGLAPAIELTTNVDDLQTAVRHTEHRGDIFVDEVDSINLAASDARGDEIVETGNGQIVIRAGHHITIVDTSAGDDGNTLKDDPEIVARGDNGRIDLEADKFNDPDAIYQIVLQDEVQLNAEKITKEYRQPVTRPNSQEPDGPLDGPSPDDPRLMRTDRAIFMKADTMVFGERIELFTGEHQGTARVFSPRPTDPPPRTIDPVTGDPAPPKPRTDGVLPAFFDPSSVMTNVLEQAVVNDATGILTLDIGQQGERGLTIDIDWGAPNEVGEFENRPRRFQQINGLPADEAVFVGLGGLEGLDPEVQPAPPGAAALLTVEHFYSQANIVLSEVNDREAATKPLEVRFSVRHHESILLEATQVQQGAGTAEMIAGGVVSSTDNPNTPREGVPGGTIGRSGLENGQATFLIPSLTIPVAFIPVRDVIPEFEEREVVVQQESTVVLTQNTFQTVESTTSSSISRREFIRIRVLSADPAGQDPVPPEELPDDILSGDKLKQLFSELPDGRYQIEYVLGDANQRSVLQVDVRRGIATIPGEELEEGILRLKRLRREASEEAAEDATLEQPDELPPAEKLPIKHVPREALLEDPSEMLASSPPPVLAGLALATALQRHRRAGKKRLSVAGRFAARGHLRNQTQRDCLE